MLGRGPSLHHKNIIGLNGLWIALASPAMTQMSQRQRRLVLSPYSLPSEPLMRRATILSSLILASWVLSAQAETVVRYGISLADIPLTTGQPDRGAGAYQFTGHTIYDSLVAWEMDIADRPGKLIAGLATEWKVDGTNQKRWTFALRHGVKFHDGSTFNADAVIWNLDKVLEEKSPQFDKRQSAQVRPRLP